MKEANRESPDASAAPQNSKWKGFKEKTRYFFFGRTVLKEEIQQLKGEIAELKKDLALTTVGQGMITEDMDVKSTCVAIAKDAIEKVKCDYIRLFRVLEKDGKQIMVGEIGLDSYGRKFDISDYPPKIEGSSGRITSLAYARMHPIHLEDNRLTPVLTKIEITPDGRVIRTKMNLPIEIMSKVIRNANSSGVWEKVEIPIIEKKIEDGQEVSRVTGVLVADNKRTKFPISDNKIIVLYLAAQLAGILIRKAEMLEQLKELSIADPLTGLYNRRYFKESLFKEIKKMIRTKRNMSLIMADLDNFKDVNENYGHQAGDYVLKSVSKMMESALRKENDIISRWGGEEFAIILPESDSEGASQIAERIRKLVESAIMEWTDEETSKEIKITCSFGICDCKSCIDSLEKFKSQNGNGNKIKEDRWSIMVATIFDGLVYNADRMLRDAKKEGKNRIKIFSE